LKMKKTQKHPWGEMDWLANSELGSSESVSVARMRVAPEGITERHRHPNCDEVVLVLEGKGELELDGKSFNLAPGDCRVVPAGRSHLVRNVGSQELLLVLSYGSGQRIYEPC
jgi:mannose-6-phosphate isomerase-like protein (cupin superfamily)